MQTDCQLEEAEADEGGNEMKFEVGERVQVIYENELKTGAITNLYILDALVNFDSGDQKDGCIPFAHIMKLDQPKPVVVPKETADFIKTYGSSNDRYSVLATIMKDIINCYSPDTDDLFTESLDKNIQAVLNGYVIEKEKKYYVRIITIADDDDGYLNLYTNKDGSFDYNIGSSIDGNGFKTKFTETEIKAIDERLWALAVPVEEVEAE